MKRREFQRLLTSKTHADTLLMTENTQMVLFLKWIRRYLPSIKITSYAVEEHATQPAIPGDKEVILVARDFGVLPAGIVVDVIEVSLPDKLAEPTP